MVTVFDIIKLTLKNNCGQCGEPTCMSFATKVVTRGLDIRGCPYIKEIPAELAEKTEGGGPRDNDPETALLKELREKIRGIDLSRIAADLGAGLKTSNKGAEVVLELPFFDDVVYVSKDELTSAKDIELDPRDQILIYNYCFFGGRGPVSGQWVGLESFPNSVSKVSTLKRYTEDKLSEEFSSNIEALTERVTAIGGQLVEPCSADLCFEIQVFPKLILRFHFWGEEPEEGFSARAKVLYDRRAIEFLDLESLVFAAERAVEKIIHQ
ncbi:hypothetical protein DBT_1865 [Dissulfuribacter thermophilus]|uniref:4Fe-4S domain-containing protein n=1 Tax=Dissulfuribacter thermophilus TaxID=1156395 RepID=A0A1B9F4Q8_9BACT|nr:DUF3786 domain-containing protein [Dissulfuribacter thermophilus]OCC14805.1 hypothetical protein DBT_1865 [Dissulfuribacter thermophilus]